MIRLVLGSGGWINGTRNKEGGKSLGVGGKKYIIDFCLLLIRLLPKYNVFGPEK